ncbi:MAG: FAD-dependent oxidoreductase [Aquabacterium sp.]
MIKKLGVNVKFNQRVRVDDLVKGGFDEIVLATGIVPRTPDIHGLTHPKVMCYLDVLRDDKPVGKTVAVIGAGGIGLDMSEYLTHDGTIPFAELPTTSSCRMGHRSRVKPTVAASRPRMWTRPRARSTCCSASQQDRRRPRQDHGLDPPQRR